MEKVDWVVDDEFERRYPEHYSCSVTVTMKDGAEYTSVVDDPKGDYRNPVTQQELEDKFRNLARRELDEGRVEQVISFVMNVQDTDDVGGLFSLIS
jgi:2-methylcitrate dehydratase PrpD